MSLNYKQLTENIRADLNPERLAFSSKFSSDLATVSYSDVLVFIRTAMKGVEPAYTQKSKDAGENVKTHLNVLPSKSFEYQGSVMTNTHIKGLSDIDLLVISEKFYSFDSVGISNVLDSPDRLARFYQSSINKLQSEKERTNYAGDALQDLMDLRMGSEKILAAQYVICDMTKPKSIKIKNQNLNREVDVVIASWYDDVTSIINDKGMYRGIQVYNKSGYRETADYPFLSIQKINTRGNETNSRLRKMIRFLKNIKKYTDHEILLSSFDINAVCYDIDVSRYNAATFLELVPLLYLQLKSIVENTEHAERIVSVDGREYIFRGKTAKIENLRKLLYEVQSIYVDYLKIM